MEIFDNIIIGFGKGGKTLAGTLASAGQKTALIEKDAQMYGGTCINVACIPSKSLDHSAQLSAKFGGDFEAKATRYEAAIQRKSELTAMLRKKNYDKAASSGVKIIDGSASFVDAHHIHIDLAEGGEEVLESKRIFINTGARPFVPPIPGLKESPHVYVSETMMALKKLPKHLLIIGGGYIGIEFASYYSNFGSEVTVIQDGDIFLPREDAEIAAAVQESLEKRGVRILKNAKIQTAEDNTDGITLHIETSEGPEDLLGDAVLVAAGRRPNLEGLHPENAGVELTERGAVKTDEKLQTTADNIWAMGDIVGGLQFTYISLDDFRIVKSQILGDGARTTKNRGAVPYSVFLDPPFSRVGLTEAEAKAKGFEIKTAKMPAGAIPKAQVLQKTTGILKVIIDAKTNQILGAHLFCAESQEMINIIKIAMDAQLPYTVLRDNIFTHPTMSEGLNDLFSLIK